MTKYHVYLRSGRLKRPPQPWSKIRVNPTQLDHFSSYIPSPHLMQDPPFGPKTLKFSSGQLVKVPNVIQTTIPQRIARQHTQYCTETGSKAFSKLMMLHVLNECKASTRKSLQGLDYFVAEGVPALNELEGLVLQLGELGKSCKVAKFYLRGNFRVSNQKFQEVQKD